MFETKTLEEVLRESGVLGTRPPSASGWYELKCPLCLDYKCRAGFKFDPSGATAYHCFNCAHVAVFTPGKASFSNKMQQVLTAFSIPPSLSKRVLFKGFVERQADAEQLDPLSEPASAITLPKTFRPIDPIRDQQAIQYVVSRGLAVDAANWHVAISADTRWSNRVIIPVYNQYGTLVFYQGRSFNNSKKRWESPPVSKTGVIFNHNCLYGGATSVVVCEGIFDALSVGGVAILGSEFSAYHVKELNKFQGTKIIVPNKDSNGKHLAEQAIELGYSISFPDIGSCEDLNAALIRYGKHYILHQVYEKLYTGAKAQMRLGVWCGV